MTLDEAIKKQREIAEEKFNNAFHIMDKMKSDIALENAEEYKRCAEEHRQLAEWLTDYKRLLEQEPSDKQRYVVRGINNDKIEFIDKYSVRAFNRYIKFIKDLCKYEVLNKIRAEIKALSPEPTAYDVVDGNPIKDAVWETLADVLQIIDKYNEMMEKAANMPNASFNDMQVSTLCCIAEKYCNHSRCTWQQAAGFWCGLSC